MDAFAYSPGALFRAAALAAGLVVAGCADTTMWTPAEAPHHSTVEWVTYDHTVAFAPGARTLAPEEKKSLDRFLAEVATTRNDQILVGAAAPPSSAAEAELADRRRDAVDALLRKHRRFSQALPPSPAAGRWDGAITVQVGRWILTPPSCGAWNKAAGIEHDNRRLPNLGCAVTANADRHLVDPGDLVRGREPGPTDAEGSTYYLRKWRQGEREILPIVRPTGSFETKGREVK